MAGEKEMAGGEENHNDAAEQLLAVLAQMVKANGTGWTW